MISPRSLLMLLLSACGPLFLHAAPLQTEIHDVIVYPDRAVITRSGTVDLPQGLQEVKLEGLPWRLDVGSLQAFGEGTASATLLDVDAKTESLPEETSPRIQDLEKQLSEWDQRKRMLEDQIANNAQQVELVGKVENYLTTPVEKQGAGTAPGTMAMWQQLLEFSSQNRGRLQADLRGFDQRGQDMDEQIRLLKDELNELRGNQPSNRTVTNVTLRFDVAEAGNLKISLTYALSGASWSPAYDARYDSQQRSLALGYFGVVQNKTGEDWNAVDLTLSTARPSLGASAPEPSPWFVDVFQPLVSGRWNYDKDALPSLKVAGENGGAEPQALAGYYFAEAAPVRGKPAPASSLMRVAQAGVDRAGTSASFHINTALTLASDGGSRKVPVAQLILSPEIEYKATPAVSPTAYLQAKAKNVTDAPLLAGPVCTFIDGTFVATARIDTVMPGANFELSMGADEGISIERKQVGRFTEQTGFGNKTTRVTYEIQFTIKNHKDAPSQLAFREPLPTSRNEKIEVKLIQPTDKNVADTKENGPPLYRDQDGILNWRLDLNPGEERTIPLKFSVEYPSDAHVSGL